MPAEEKKEVKGRDISRRQFFKEAGAVSAAVAAAAALSVVGPEEAEARTTFAEFFQKNYRLMTDEEKKEVFVEAESGALFNHLVRYTISEGLQGLEGFLGTPGTIGGALFNNAHFKDKLIGDFVTSAVILTKEGRKDVDRSYFRFAYDYSILHETHDILLSAVFCLLPGNKEELWKIATESVTRRRDTQPLDLPSSGCAWKNVEGGKLSTGYLIDECGLKERSVGGAKISGKHANFIVNGGRASAQDVITLMKLAHDVVKEKFGYTLEPEIFFIGEFQENPFRKE